MSGSISIYAPPSKRVTGFFQGVTCDPGGGEICVSVSSHCDDRKWIVTMSYIHRIQR